MMEEEAGGAELRGFHFEFHTTSDAHIHVELYELSVCFFL